MGFRSKVGALGVVDLDGVSPALGDDGELVECGRFSTLSELVEIVVSS